jgi:hypothetical protein
VGCRSLTREADSGIVALVSSKTARLRRRQATRRKMDKRLRKSGRVPQHTRAERKRAEAERQRQNEVDEHRQARLRRVVFPAIASVGAASVIFAPVAKFNSGHNSYPLLSAAELARSDNPDLPHMPERDMTYYTSSVEAGTARTDIFVGPVPSETWYGLERYGPYGPNIFEN